MYSMYLCNQCICECGSRGERFAIEFDTAFTYEESIENNQPCEFCGEYDELSEVIFR